MRLFQLNDNNVNFPSVESALLEPNGLLAFGGDLKPNRLIQAYRQGIFPWYSEGEPLMWWSPDPRAIILKNNLHINRTLRKFIKKTSYKISLNSDFTQVIKQCAHAPFRKDGTWILPEMIDAYINLHKLGYAHSIEVWETSLSELPSPTRRLVGGLYGVAINGLFSGESMFYSQPNASKIALIALSQLLNSIDIEMIDCQINNSFLADMGACDIKRDQFIEIKDHIVDKKIDENFWQPRELFLNSIDLS